MCGGDKTVFFWVISQSDHELQPEGRIMDYNLRGKDMIKVNVLQSPDAKESLSPRLIPFLS